MFAFLVSNAGVLRVGAARPNGALCRQQLRWRSAGLQAPRRTRAGLLLAMSNSAEGSEAADAAAAAAASHTPAQSAEQATVESPAAAVAPSEPHESAPSVRESARAELSSEQSAETEREQDTEGQAGTAGQEKGKVSARGGDTERRRGPRGARPGRRNQRLPRLPLSEVQVGSLVKGKVRSIVPYGAFVDIGTVTDGLLHVSQMSLEYVRDIESIMKVGDEINVRVISVDLEKKEFSLTLLPEGVDQERKEMVMAARERRRAAAYDENPAQSAPVARRNESRRQQMLKEAVSLLSDNGSKANAAAPSTEAANAATATSADADADAEAAKEAPVPGAKRDAAQKRGAMRQWFESTPAAKDQKLFIPGKVVSIEEYGAFVAIGAPTDGLVHISEISKDHVSKVEDQLKIGDEVQVRVIGVDQRRGRISLSMKPYEERQPKASSAAEKRASAQPEFKTTMELAFEKVRDQLVAAGLMK